MQSPGRIFMEMLPAMAQAWLVAGVVIAGVLITGLILLAIAIRTEDADAKLGRKAPGPISGRVRHLLRLHIYTRDDFTYGTPVDSRREEAINR